MKMLNPVRVRLENGGETTVAASYAAAKGLTVIDERAVNRSGQSLPPAGMSAADQVAAAIDEDIAALKGPALTQALDDAGLAKSGSADDKRARLAEHRANAVNLTPEPSTDGSGTADVPEGTD